MAFFAPELTPFFRLLDEYSVQPQSRGRRHGGHGPAFTPKFDLWEVADKYVIQGEVPGVPMENISIEWHKDALQISGKVYHKTERSSTPPHDTSAEAQPAQTQDSSSAKGKEKQATVEEDAAAPEEGLGGVVTPPEDGATTKPAEATAAGTGAVAKCERHTVGRRCSNSNYRYWVSERSFGQFNRSFTFPTPIAHDDISATLNHGVLEVTVPKTQAPAPRRIQINRAE